ncbi:TetR/AcrR family transcriptional regulator [Novosphingobium album (ex Hu et al. 2023)]|uniref:TetR/AcrR family transcriptional regulator n=1 Tax=Novosphingobium album (ex Hu et al. 2023) TaxID=2930093 RepID=A0ABT0B1E6_9SPHN|nr:TetR/AcrR family transcriptional regulator [Novosphingobium album (ex Hu et al. 2023)]MCJ2178749.1 TetR/AcrR family transcriptional regulator [Novosphingobium album (ex Hu et al. 2023)]
MENQTTAIRDRVLSALQPDHQAEPPAKWQQRKSAKMRDRLVSAAVDCLVESGYPGLTTAAVATRSGVSRGAMHHHFPTRMELVAAVVDHVVYHRMRTFLADYFEAVENRQGEPLIELACEAHWRSVQTRDYSAWLELTVAARTDGELAAIFHPAARRYDEVWTSEMIEAFPQWQDHWDLLKLANDFTSAMHMGMLLHGPVFGSEDRMERLRRFAARTMQDLYETR